MTHFHINHIDDVLPHLAGHPEFVVAQRPGYQVIDYNFAAHDSFDQLARLECRGLKFDTDGRIIARPLHKFFNISEREDTQPHLLDFSHPHTVMEKMDGSMIHPALVDGELLFMTRMGHTDHAKAAERHITEDLDTVCHILLTAGFTPIFEWTAPDNRIVVRYPDSRLTLLAVRDTVTGDYVPRGDLEDLAQDMGVAVVPTHSSAATGAEFVALARAVTGIEGFVIRFDSGLWVKAKGDDYVLKHKAKESVLQEKNVLALVLRGELDDVLPLLEPEDRVAVEVYRDAVWQGVSASAAVVAGHVASGAHLDQKSFAVEHQQGIAPNLRPLAFQARGGTDAGDAVKGALLKSVGSQTAVDAARHLHGASFALG